MARIIIASYVVRLPVGGYQSWMLQWMLGFRQLGHDVYFVEKSGWPGSCIDPHTWARSDDCTFGVAAWSRTLALYGLERNWCYVDAQGTYYGLSRNQIEEVFRTADVYMDFLRENEWREEASLARIRVMMDGEPAYTQMLMEKKAAAGASLSEYDYYYTVGLNIGTERSTAPTAGKRWRPIFDPIMPELYPLDPPPANAPFTSIMSWQPHEPMVYQGITYGLKDVEFSKFIDLPKRVKPAIELAISGKEVPEDELRRAGWHLKHSGEATITFDAWRSYIQGSRGEFSVAKSYFVVTNSGAFSDRSAVYLISGRPVIMQDTGFSEHLPCGRGLFAARDVEEAAAAIDSIDGNFEQQSKWARELAMEYLRAPVVAGRFLKELGL